MTRTLLFSLAAGLLATSAFAAPAKVAAPPKIDPALHDRALETLKRGIAFNTSAGAGNTVAYAEYLKGLLVAGGYKADEIVIEPMKGTAFLIARYPGTDPTRKPIVISGHMDVVAANPADWSRDPFTPVVEGGYIYGRGAEDNKFDVSVVVTTMAHLRSAGWKPGRGVILALSGDEETTMDTTAVLAQRLKDAELVLNDDGGGGALAPDGTPVAYGIQGAEKTYADFELSVTDPGGHSSRPTPTNAIYRLAKALDRIAAYRFPAMQNEITKGAALAEAATAPAPIGEALRRFAANPADQGAIETLSADPNYLPMLRTTCVATMISGGHAANALPQRAGANINCRIFPGTSSESVRQVLIGEIADPSVKVTRAADGSVDSPASPLRPDVLAAITKAVHARYPGLPVIPSQSSGATDSMYFRNQGIPSYGVSGIFQKPGESFAHGLNEKAPLATLDGDLLHWDMILRDLAK